MPAATEAQRRPYALLLEAMRESGVVGLGSFVLAGKEKLCLIRPKGHALALETLFLAEDVKGQEEIDEPVAATGVKKEELALARQIISGLEGEFDPAGLKSDYRAKLRELLEAKLEGRELAEPRARGRGRAGHRPDGGAAGLGRGLEGQPGREEARGAQEARRTPQAG